MENGSNHLCTITHLKTGSTIDEYSFDAWGRRRDKDNWSYTLSSEPALFAGRGFTAHEYLEDFKLYNMNGRLYDPVVGRFLSPDPYIQDAGFTQGYNRYSYVLNNPLKYADPTGFKKKKVEEGDYFTLAGYLNYLHSRLAGGGTGPRDWGSNPGLGGVYFDWATGQYRSVETREIVGSADFYYSVSPYTREVEGVYYAGSRQNPYETLTGLYFNDGSTYYFSDNTFLSNANVYKESRQDFGNFKLKFTPQEGFGLNGSAFYRGSIETKQVNGKWYVEGYAEVIPVNTSTSPKFWANLKVYQDGKEVGYSYFNINNEIGSHFYDATWTKIGYGRAWLPATGNVQVQLNIGHSTYTFFNGFTNQIIYSNTYKYP